MKGYMVCGWYTQDYWPWYDQLARDLRMQQQPHDFVAVEKAHGAGWEETTMRKADMVLRAMDRFPDKVIVFIDVDCMVKDCLAPLMDLRGDVGVFFHPRMRSGGRIRAHIRSGTMVFKPNEAARKFVARWRKLGETAGYGAVDQDTLLMALDTPGVTLELLDVKWCFTKLDKCDDPIIVHASASKSMKKIGLTQRRFNLLKQIFTLRDKD